MSVGLNREREREREYFIEEGNRAPVSKATHSRYREGPVRREREREREREMEDGRGPTVATRDGEPGGEGGGQKNRTSIFARSRRRTRRLISPSSFLQPPPATSVDLKHGTLKRKCA